MKKNPHLPSFEELFALCETVVRSYKARLDADEMDDLIQESAIKIWMLITRDKLPALSSPSEFMKYLRQLVHNHVRDDLRKRGRLNKKRVSISGAKSSRDDGGKCSELELIDERLDPEGALLRERWKHDAQSEAARILPLFFDYALFYASTRRKDGAETFLHNFVLLLQLKRSSLAVKECAAKLGVNPNQLERAFGRVREAFEDAKVCKQFFLQHPEALVWKENLLMFAREALSLKQRWSDDPSPF